MRGVVVPRTIESSTTMTRWPRRFSTTGLNFKWTPRVRIALIGADERAPDITVLDQPSMYGSPLSAAYPMPPATAESGTAITTSASTGCSRASCRPIS